MNINKQWCGIFYSQTGKVYSRNILPDNNNLFYLQSCNIVVLGSVSLQKRLELL
jgi:hypothetical protein